MFTLVFVLFGITAPPRQRPFFLVAAILGGVLPWLRAIKHRRLLLAYPAGSIPGTPTERRFLAWIKGRRVVITWVLLGILGAAFLWQLVSGLDESIWAAGQSAPLVREGEYWRLVTATLIHAGFLHVAFNGMALAALGWLVEALTGWARLALVFLVSAIGGSMCSYLLSPGWISVGASGGIVGLLAFLAVLVAPRRRGYPRGLRRYLFGIIILVLVTGLAAPGFIDNAGHAGGFAAGALAGFLLLRTAPTVPQPAGLALRSAGTLSLVIVLSSTAGMMIFARDNTTGLAGLVHQSWERLGRSDYDGALRKSDALVKILPEYHAGWWHRAIALANLGRDDEAERDFTEAIRLEPTVGRIYLDRAGSRWRLGKFEEARRDYDEGVRREPKNAAGLMQRAAFLWDREDLRGAAADYEAVLEIEPRHVEALGWRWRARANMSDLDGAVRDLDLLAEIEPDNVDHLVNRAWVRVLRKDYDQALADSAKALALKPDHPYALSTRAQAREGKGDLDGAKADYSEAIGRDAGHEYAYVLRGRMRAAKGDLDGAFEDYEKALKLNAKDHDALLARGQARVVKGAFADARADFEAALKAAPSWWRSRLEAEAALKNLVGR